MSEGITFVVPSTTAPTLPNGVIAAESLKGEGDAPGATAYVHYNGPTDQLATMCTGMCVLEPGATPHPPHTHKNEEILIIKSGTVEAYVNGEWKPAPTGSLIFFASMVPHTVRNTSTKPATYFVLNWAALGTKPKKVETK